MAHRRARVDMVDLRLSGVRFARTTRMCEPLDRATLDAYVAAPVAIERSRRSICGVGSSKRARQS